MKYSRAKPHKNQSCGVIRYCEMSQHFDNKIKRVHLNNHTSSGWSIITDR